MKDLITNPYSFDAYQIERDRHGRVTINKAKIMKAGKLKYQTADGKVYYGNITVDELRKAIPTATIKPVTIKHPPKMLTASDVMNYQEGTSADGYDIEEIDGEQWLTGPLVLASERATKTVEDGKLGISAGYYRDAVPTNEEGVFDFKNIDINHIAIGCDNPRAEGAGISLDEAGEDSAKVYSFAEKQQPKRRTIMKQKLNAVKVGDFSLDEAPISYDEAGEGTEQAISTLVSREEKLVSYIKKQEESMDEREQSLNQKINDLSGESKALKQKVTDLEEEKKTMISMDDLDSKVHELAEIRELANFYKIDGKFNTPFEGQKLIVQKVYPKQSFDDAEIPGAFKTIQHDKEDVKEILKSNQAKERMNQHSMDENKIGIAKIDPLELKKKIKKA